MQPGSCEECRVSRAKGTKWPVRVADGILHWWPDPDPAWRSCRCSVVVNLTIANLMNAPVHFFFCTRCSPVLHVPCQALKSFLSYSVRSNISCKGEHNPSLPCPKWNPFFFHSAKLLLFCTHSIRLR